MDIFLLVARLFLFAVFAIAGIAKLLDLKGSERAMRDFGVPGAFAGPLGIALPLIELSIAFLLLPSSTSWVAAIAALALLIAFIAGMAFQISKGNAPDCHCFGQLHSEPVGQKSLARNLLLSAIPLILVAQGRDGQGISAIGWVEGLSAAERMQLGIGLLLSGLLAAAIFYLKRIAEKQDLLSRQIEVMQIVSGEGAEKAVERDNIVHPMEGLPIGSPVPDFHLPGLSGKNVRLEHLLMKAKPLLFFFVSPNCDPCKALAPEIEQWKKELSGRVEFVFISNGSANENKGKFGNDSVVLLQDAREVAESLQAFWTPTCLLIGADGSVASRLAAGDKAIRDFIELIKKQEHLDYVVNENGGGQNPPNIGAGLPDFELDLVDGGKFSAKSMRGRKTVVTFWSNDCPYCLKMIDGIREWEKEKGDSDPSLVLFSEGGIEENRGLGADVPVVIDNERKISGLMGMYGTPSAVLVNEEGKIASETAFGARQIWSLLGKRV